MEYGSDNLHNSENVKYWDSCESGKMKEMEPVDDQKDRKRKRNKLLLRILRSTLLAVSVYAPLFWIYIVLRIVFDNVGVFDLFIDGVPYFSFWITGIWAFLIGFISLVAYLSIRDTSRPLINIHFFNKEETELISIKERKGQL